MASESTLKRLHGRAYNQLRPITIRYNQFGYAPASVLFELGNTKVLCAASLQQQVPPFLKGTKTGWLKAEYAMLPTATQMRTQRDATSQERNGRSIEISRLIGRSLRSIIDLQALGERTIIIDCDVLQADGGTRTACITGASLALHAAVNCWVSQGMVTSQILKGHVAAISAGLHRGHALLDIDFAEDSIIDADYNFVLTDTGAIVEIQGASERSTISWQEFDAMKEVVVQGITSLFEQIRTQTPHAQEPRVSLFSLQNRLKSQ